MMRKSTIESSTSSLKKHYQNPRVDWIRMEPIHKNKKASNTVYGAPFIDKKKIETPIDEG